MGYGCVHSHHKSGFGRDTLAAFLWPYGVGLTACVLLAGCCVVVRGGLVMVWFAGDWAYGYGFGFSWAGLLGLAMVGCWLAVSFGWLSF